jgi:hypothetical protein
VVVASRSFRGHQPGHCPPTRYDLIFMDIRQKWMA